MSEEGHVRIVEYVREPNESGWWAVKSEPGWVPVFEWVEEEE